jgi:hypothetical protein
MGTIARARDRGTVATQACSMSHSVADLRSTQRCTFAIQLLAYHRTLESGCDTTCARRFLADPFRERPRDASKRHRPKNEQQFPPLRSGGGRVGAWSRGPACGDATAKARTDARWLYTASALTASAQPCGYPISRVREGAIYVVLVAVIA